MKNPDVQIPADVARDAAQMVRDGGLADTAVLAVDGHLWSVLASRDAAGLPGNWQTFLRIVAADNPIAQPPYLLAGPRGAQSAMLGELGDGLPRQTLSRQSTPGRFWLTYLRLGVEDEQLFYEWSVMEVDAQRGVVVDEA